MQTVKLLPTTIGAKNRVAESSEKLEKGDIVQTVSGEKWRVVNTGSGMQVNGVYRVLVAPVEK